MDLRCPAKETPSLTPRGTSGQKRLNCERRRAGLSCGGTGGRILVALTREGDMAHYLLPKGGVEKGESLLEAARREIQEEAGIFRVDACWTN